MPRRDGQSWRERIDELAYEQAIPGRSGLHGAFVWTVPPLAGAAQYGVRGFLISAAATALVWYQLLPAFDRAMLRHNVASAANGEANLERIVANGVTRPLGVLWFVLMAVSMATLAAYNGINFTTIAYVIIANLGADLVTYVAGELLWSRYVGVGTRLRLYERRYDLLEKVFEKDGTVEDFHAVAQLHTGERFERTYGWQRDSKRD